MSKLTKNDAYCVVYGEYDEEKDKELFRCPREAEETNLREYVNSSRDFLGLEQEESIEYIKEMKEKTGYQGYFRMYFRNGTWYGSWFETSQNISNLSIKGVSRIVRFLQEKFPCGCNSTMQEYLKENFSPWGASDTRYLLKPLYSDHYRIMFDTLYGNEDYPVRIYVFEE